MGRKIIGATVGTTLNPKKIEEILGLTPNKDGNVTLADGRVIYFGTTLPEDAPAGSVLIDLSKQESNGGIAEETDPTVPAWAKKPEPPKLSELENDAGFITAEDLPSGGGGFGLPLLYETTTTEEVQWIDTGDAFLAKNVLIVELISKVTATNTADNNGSVSIRGEGLAVSYPWSNYGIARVVKEMLPMQYDKKFVSISIKGNSGAWNTLHSIRTMVNKGEITQYSLTSAMTCDITGIVIGDASALEGTRVLGVGTTLKIWGC